MHGGLTGNERDVRHHPGKPIAYGRLEVREHCDPTDLLRRHHETHLHRRLSSVQHPVAATERPNGVHVRCRSDTAPRSRVAFIPRVVRRWLGVPAADIDAAGRDTTRSQGRVGREPRRPSRPTDFQAVCHGWGRFVVLAMMEATTSSRSSKLAEACEDPRLLWFSICLPDARQRRIREFVQQRGRSAFGRFACARFGRPGDAMQMR
jgi:hypothetical protein